MKKSLTLAALVSGSLLAVAGVAQASPTTATCPEATPMGNAKLANVAVTGPVDATGCDIGVYNPTAVTAGADIHGATQYGVVVDGATKVDVTGAHVHEIGDPGFSGNQYGVGIYYTNGATGTISDSQIYRYQKGGIVAKQLGTNVTVTNNNVDGLGKVNFIAQNGIQISSDAAATLTKNTVSSNYYTGKSWAASGILFYGATSAPKVGTIRQANTLVGNQTDVAVIK